MAHEDVPRRRVHLGGLHGLGEGGLGRRYGFVVPVEVPHRRRLDVRKEEDVQLPVFILDRMFLRLSAIGTADMDPVPHKGTAAAELLGRIVVPRDHIDREFRRLGHEPVVDTEGILSRPGGVEDVARHQDRIDAVLARYPEDLLQDVLLVLEKGEPVQ